MSLELPWFKELILKFNLTALELHKNLLSETKHGV